MQTLLPALAVLAQAAATVAQAAPAVVGVSGLLPFVAVPLGLRPQLQPGQHLITWSDGDGADADCTDMGGAIGFANTGSGTNQAPGTPGVGGTGYTSTWVSCGGAPGQYPSFEAALAADPSAAQITRIAASHQLPMQSVTVDDATGEFQMLQPAGTLLAGGTKISAALTGGSLQVTNLRVDLVNKMVLADMSGTRAANGTQPATVFNSPGIPVWTFETVEGPAALNPADLLRSDRDAVLAAQGFAVGANGAVQATHRMRMLHLTPEATTVTINSLGLLAAGQTALAGVNDTVGQWGDLVVTTHLHLPSAQDVSTSTGQTVSTPFTLPNGVPLRLTHLSTSSALDTVPSAYDQAAPALSQMGLLPWFNAFAVNPSSFANGFGSSTTVQDPRFGVEQYEGQTRTRIRSTSPGSTLTFNNFSGALISLGGFRQDMVGDFVNSTMGGGRWSVGNIRYLFNPQEAQADLSGTRGAIGNTAAQPVASQPSTRVWTYGAAIGPTTLPLQALSGAASVSALPAILQGAGFTINSVSSTAIQFTGAYRFADLNATVELKNYMCLALACTSQAKRALTSSETDYIGQHLVNVRFSLPLVP